MTKSGHPVWRPPTTKAQRRSNSSWTSSIPRRKLTNELHLVEWAHLPIVKWPGRTLLLTDFVCVDFSGNWTKILRVQYYMAFEVVSNMPLFFTGCVYILSAPNRPIKILWSHKRALKVSGDAATLKTLLERESREYGDPNICIYYKERTRPYGLEIRQPRIWRG